MSNKTQTADPLAVRSMVRHIIRLYCTGELSDMTVTCGDNPWSSTSQFRVHKLVLGSHSTTLRDMIGEDDELIRIQIPEFSPSVVRVMAHYFYFQTLDIPSRPPSTEQLMFVLQVYLIAIRYQVSPMDELAFKLLSDACDSLICGETFIQAMSQIHADRYDHGKKEVGEILAQITLQLLLNAVARTFGVQTPPSLA